MRAWIARGCALLLLSMIATALVSVPVAGATVGSSASLSTDRPIIEPGSPDPLNCTIRATIPEIDNVVSAAWSPDSSALALVHTANVASRKTVTGYEEDQRVAVFNVATGRLRDLGHGNRPSWSATGALLAYWDDDGSIHVLLSGQIVAELDASQPGFGWNGDALLYWKGDEIREWSMGVKWTLAHVRED